MRYAAASAIDERELEAGGLNRLWKAQPVHVDRVRSVVRTLGLLLDRTDGSTPCERSAGLPTFEIATTMGTSLGQLSKTYAHLLPDSTDRARVALDAFITNAGAVAEGGARLSASTASIGRSMRRSILWPPLITSGSERSATATPAACPRHMEAT